MNENATISVNGQTIEGEISHKTFEKIIILVHGFTGNMHGPKNLYDELAFVLLENGYSVYQFNFR